MGNFLDNFLAVFSSAEMVIYELPVMALPFNLSSPICFQDMIFLRLKDVFNCFFSVG